MALLRLVLTCAIFVLPCIIFQVRASLYVPVLMLDNVKTDTPIPALNHINKDDFKDIFAEKLQNKNTIVVVFAEESLSPEDLTLFDFEGKNVFSRLSEMRKKWQSSYYSYVENPIEILKKSSKNAIEVPSTKVKNLKVQPGQTLIIDLNDARDNEDRAEMLIRHDNIIYSAIKKIVAEHKDIVAFYTGRHSSWESSNEEENVRQRRHLLATEETTKNETKMIFKNDNVLLYVSATPVLSYDNHTYSLSACKTSKDEEESANSTLTEVKLDMCYDVDKTTNKITFNITTDETGYWFLSQIDVKDAERTLYLNNSIFAPVGFSYHCVKTRFSSVNDTVILSLPGLQLQPDFSKSANISQFSSAYDCVGFTSGPIWSGIFVTFILALIMTFGLCMIMDIKTMDRFDDPKGKTISINVSE